MWVCYLMAVVVDRSREVGGGQDERCGGCLD
jgi:hypothetical protein